MIKVLRVFCCQGCDNGKIDPKDCDGVVLYTAERAMQAIRCLGGNGYVNEYPTGLSPSRCQTV